MTHKLANVEIDGAKTYFRVKLNWYAELILPMTSESYKFIEQVVNGTGIAVTDWNYHSVNGSSGERVASRGEGIQVSIVSGNYLLTAMMNQAAHERGEAEKLKTAVEAVSADS